MVIRFEVPALLNGIPAVLDVAPCRLSSRVTKRSSWSRSGLYIESITLDFFKMCTTILPSLCFGLASVLFLHDFRIQNVYVSLPPMSAGSCTHPVPFCLMKGIISDKEVK